MNINKKNSVHFVAEAAIIAALYAVLTIAIKPLSYGMVQFRFSEALCILPVFTSAAVPGLTVGCFIANLLGSDFPLDMLFGTLATLLAAIHTRGCRNKTIKNVPVLSSFFPVIFNAMIVGFEIAASSIRDLSELSAESFFKMFAIAGAWVGLGEIVCACILGLVLYFALEKIGFRKIIIRSQV